MKCEISAADKLEEFKFILKKATKGFRKTKYDVTQGTMESVIEMRFDADALEEFVERNGIDPLKLGSADKSWITAAAFKFVAGDNLGWKCARVARFLYDFKKVPIEELAEQIRMLGGIEKIGRLAAKEDPLQTRAPRGTRKNGSKAGKSLRKPIKAASAGDYIAGAAQDDGLDGKQALSVVNNGSILVGIKDYLRAKLEDVLEGERVKLVVTRSDSWDEAFLFEVQKVIPIVKKRRMRWGEARTGRGS